MAHMLMLALLFSSLYVTTMAAVIAIVNDTTLVYAHDKLTIAVDPPSGFSAPSALGVFAQSNSPTAIIFYTITWNVAGSSIPPEPTYPMYDPVTKYAGIDKVNGVVYESPTTYVCFNTTPYIHLTTPYGMGRLIKVVLVAIDYDSDRLIYSRSQQYVLDYAVEASARPGA